MLPRPTAARTAPPRQEQLHTNLIALAAPASQPSRFNHAANQRPVRMNGVAYRASNHSFADPSGSPRKPTIQSEVKWSKTNAATMTMMLNKRCLIS